jgi:iron complex outermembrane receptor protein
MMSLYAFIRQTLEEQGGTCSRSELLNAILRNPEASQRIADNRQGFPRLLQNMRHSGFIELSGDVKLGQALGIKWGAEAQADYVRATVRNFGPAPLIPPLRFLGALTASRGQVDGRLEIERALAHDRTAPNETDTPGYTMVNASLDWHPLAARPELTLSLIGNNLFDVEARRSTSLLKDFAPLAGRDIRLSARMAF